MTTEVICKITGCDAEYVEKIKQELEEAALVV